jgi:hypothetical protein
LLDDLNALLLDVSLDDPLADNKLRAFAEEIENKFKCTREYDWGLQSHISELAGLAGLYRVMEKD